MLFLKFSELILFFSVSRNSLFILFLFLFNLRMFFISRLVLIFLIFFTCLLEIFYLLSYPRMSLHKPELLLIKDRDLFLNPVSFFRVSSLCFIYQKYVQNEKCKNPKRYLFIKIDERNSKYDHK